MQCPFCKSPSTEVIDTRECENGTSVKRRRRCRKCDRRFTTVESTQLLVSKKSGRFELFDEGKIVKGLKKACKGRPVTTEDILSIAQQVEDSIRSEGVVRVSSRQIGLAILEPLKKLDAVAYLRFASVYENFTCAEDFKRAAADLQNSK